MPESRQKALQNTTETGDTVRMMRRHAIPALVLVLAALALGAVGCGGAAAPAAGVPDSASLAPADAHA